MTATARAARALLLRVLSRMHTGALQITDADGTVHRLGTPGAEPSATIRVNNPRAWVALLRGSRGLAESYVDGWWESDDLVAVIRVAARNVDGLDRARERLEAVRGPYQWATGVRRRNTVARARSDIHAHYDLGNDLFELMLDETMMYSSGVFHTPEATLRDASIAKLELVCDKLGLGPDSHVVEIGTGWGGFAVHAATTRGCRVTTTTISAEQHDYATRRVQEAGVADRVTVLRDDYRDLRGEYDALVSLEMIEAVGWRDLPTFFAQCDRLLAPHGAMLLQAIAIDDRAYAVERASRSFIRTHIFPGGTLPSPGVIARNVARETTLQPAHFEDLTRHYVRTLQAWRRNVEARAQELETRGYDGRFRRLWRMYLAYCEGGFAERRITVGQHLLVKPRWRGEVPRTALAGPAGLETTAPPALARWLA
ncbi:MAG TPA: cyclopropane-fatty-acyl-phospholipid synthase family protein [Baekduia sp.]|nr:cyclopropane-fatty-acyl-phospholipid synthase family protein [Baekduia sp.]